MMIRPQILCLSLLLVAASLSISRAESFSSFVAGMKSDAVKRGISASTFANATRGLKPDPQMDRLTKKQPELVKPIGGYIERRVNGGLLKTGRQKIKSIKRTMRAIEKRYGVDPYVVAAIWGMETGYGRGIGNSDVFRSLATLGWKRYRGTFFRDEFLDALEIYQNEKIPRDQMIGSWAGAMGQTQFIPSSFLEFAVDFDGDGKRDLWRNTADALGSTANYLAKKGWKRGQPWGMPVILPKSLTRHVITQSWQDWAANGVKAYDGRTFPKKGEATLFMPAGKEGPTFLITDNYEVIRDYNSSDAYSLSVGILSQRLRGRGRFKTKWPTKPTLNKAQRMKVQELLEKNGYPVSNRTGRILKGVRLAIRDFQLQAGVVADGYPDKELLRQLQR